MLAHCSHAQNENPLIDINTQDSQMDADWNTTLSVWNWLTARYLVYLVQLSNSLTYFESDIILPTYIFIFHPGWHCWCQDIQCLPDDSTSLDCVRFKQAVENLEGRELSLSQRRWFILIIFSINVISQIVHFRVRYDRWIKEVKMHFLQP